MRNCFILILLTGILLGLSSQSLATDTSNYYQIGDTLKPANLTSITEKSVETSFFTKRILFINFFASW